jgi:hypothetical protein
VFVIERSAFIIVTQGARRDTSASLTCWLLEDLTLERAIGRADYALLFQSVQ